MDRLPAPQPLSPQGLQMMHTFHSKQILKFKFKVKIAPKKFCLELYENS